jgi:hypothetical protein
MPMPAGPIVIVRQRRTMNDRADVASASAAWPLPDAAKFTGSLTERVTLSSPDFPCISQERLDEIGDTIRVMP